MSSFVAYDQHLASSDPTYAAALDAGDAATAGKTLVAHHYAATDGNAYAREMTPAKAKLDRLKAVMSAEGVCGRTMDRICAMYEGCTIDRPGYVRRVALGHHEAVYELEVTFDTGPEAARIVQHALASWKVPAADGAWFCRH